MSSALPAGRKKMAAVTAVEGVSRAVSPSPERAAAGAFEVVESRRTPFRYFLARRCLARDVERALLEWFETAAPWRLVETDFYQQHEFDVLDAALPANAASVAARDSLAAMRRTVAAAFGVEFDERVRLTAHRLTRGQRIAIHNDYLAGEETHRLIVQVNRGLRDEDGGLFLLFDSCDPRDVHRIIRPVGGAGVGFEIGEHSNHAVSRVHGGERYTLVYSFYARPGPGRPASQDQADARPAGRSLAAGRRSAGDRKDVGAARTPRIPSGELRDPSLAGGRPRGGTIGPGRARSR